LFGVVLGLIAWIYLQSLVIVLAAEVNVVRIDGLWPRGIQALTTHDDPDVLTHADRRSYRGYAQTQRFKKYERIEVEIPTGAPVDHRSRALPLDADGQPSGG
jgi:hypothetical protein